VTNHRIVLVVAGLILAVLPAISSVAAAALSADQVAVLANHNSSESLKVARHYLLARGIPSNHLIQLDLPENETITPQQYDEQVLQPVRQALVTRKLTSKVRVLVTTYGIPLSIGPHRPTSAEERWLKDAAERRRFAEAHLERTLEALSRIAPSSDPGSEPAPPESHVPPGQPDTAVMVARLDESTRAAVRRLNAVGDAKERERWSSELGGLMKLAGGDAALVQSLAPAPTADPAKAQVELNRLKQRIGWTQQVIQMLMVRPSNESREQAYKISEGVFGLLGILRFANEETAVYTMKDSDASFDSELSLLWWDHDFYRPTGRIGNPLHYANRARGFSAGHSVPVLMISRLDGPSPDIAMQLVDQALAAERDGPQGKVYVDALGKKATPGDTYGIYDQSLRDLASLVKSRTSFEVVVDDTERRFSHPGEASDALLYAGWYKLRSYEDAFGFRTGAIGYHMASAEAISLHDPGETGWCKNALEHGIAATMGSTGEPYLDSFPPPQEFFGVLLTGRFTLVEAYYVTSRYVSWRMVLIGDPLYNPWKKKEQVPESAVTFLPGPDGHVARPVPPSEQAFPDPVEAARTFRRQRQTVLDEIDHALAEAEKQEQLRTKPH